MPSSIGYLWTYMDLAVGALTVWREARGEGPPGMTAVAFSIANRVSRPSWWGNSWYSVCVKKWQYSSMTAPGDPQLGKFPSWGDREMEQALWITSEVMQGRLTNPVPGADSYYDDSIPPPAWASVNCFVGQVGRLRFYDVDQDYERHT